MSGDWKAGLVEHVPGEARGLRSGTPPRSRAAHAPQPEKPAGLDWAALAPACSTCGEKRSDVDVNTGVCHGCAHPAPKPTPAPKPVREKAPPRVNKLEEHLADLTRRYLAGETAKQLAADYGVGVSTMGNFLRQRGVQMRPPASKAHAPRPKKPRTSNGPERLQLPANEVIEAYQSGMTLQQVANRFGCSHPVIARVLTENGIARRGGRVQHTRELVATIRRLYVDEGLSQVEIAERLGSTAKVVQNVMVRAKIPTRPAVSRRPSNHAAALKQRVADLGGSHDVNVWAVREGHLPGIQVGLPPARIVDLYEAAHPQAVTA